MNRHSAPPEALPPVIITSRRYAVAVDVDVKLRRFEPAMARRHWHQLMQRPERFSGLGISQEHYSACQQRLIDALLRDESTIDQWLRNEAARIIRDGDFGPFDDVVPSGDEDEAFGDNIVAPLVPDLLASDREFFERSRNGPCRKSSTSPFNS